MATKALTTTALTVCAAASLLLNARADITTGLVGWWSFEDGAGSSNVIDGSGYGNTGTLLNFNDDTYVDMWTVASVPTNIGPWAISFNSGVAPFGDGTNTYVNIPSSASLNSIANSGAAYTVAAWVYCRVAGSNEPNNAGILCKGYLGEEGFDLDMSGGSFRSQMHNNAGSGENTVTSSNNLAPIGGSILAHTWYHVVVTYNRDVNPEMSMYIDGVTNSNCQLNTYTTLYANSAARPLTIGCRDTTGGVFEYPFEGVIDDVHIYNRALSASDIMQLYTNNGSAPIFALSLTNVMVLVNTQMTFNVLAVGPGPLSYTWYTNGTLVAGDSGTSFTGPPLQPNFTNVTVVVSNSKASITNQATVTVIVPMSPISLIGFNRDTVIESNAVGPPYGSDAQEYNPGAGTCFYESGLPGTAYGLPASGVFNSVIDLTQFQFQPYTASNALVMSSDTGLTNGTLTLVNPEIYSNITILASSTSGSSTNTGALTLRFMDNSTYLTNFYAPNWFANTNSALQGVDSINISTGATNGGPTNPRFYQTTINLAAAGLTNKALAGLTFGEAAGATATGVFAVSGLLSGANPITLATVINSPATAIQPISATLGGRVLSTGGYIPTVTLYFGPTDGGTNAAAWSNSVSFGYQSGAFSLTVTNLSPGSTYYFTAQAVNVAGTSWAAPSQVFTTLAAVPAQVTNAPATAIGATLATLNGQVLSTGGTPTTVTLYYGPADGGTNAAAWPNSVSIGLQNGAFAQKVGPLTSNTTYYATASAANDAGTAWAAPSINFTTPATNPVSTLTAVLTYRNDNTRMGVNSNETTLTLTNVNTNTFGRLFNCAVDGFVYAQPLIMTNVSIPGKGVHNVVYVATEHNSVFAFDADNNTGINAAPLWQTSFLGPGVTTVPSADIGSPNITPEIGITSTPVIDPATGTIYCEVKTLEQGTSYVHRLHALDMTTGLERTSFNSPVLISCTNYPGKGNGDNDGQTPPHVLWNPRREHCRPAFTLLNGVVYLSFASHGDVQPYHGWLFGYNATNLAQPPSVFNATPNGVEGGFWGGGGGPSVDAQGNLYLQTGNGTFDGGTTITATNDYAMSLLKFATSNGITLVDYFAPSNAVALSSSDKDLGSSAAIILPDSAGSAAHPHLVVGGGKTAPIYLVDRDNMGRFNGTTGSNQIVQQFNGSMTGSRSTTPAFFNNTLYVIDANLAIAAYKITNALFNTTPVETPDTFDDNEGASACISANGTSNAIMWVIYNTGGDSPVTPCVLRAYNATNITQKLYASDQIPSRDSAGDAVKFIIPTIANGKVYVAAQYALTVYGLAGTFVSTPVISPNGGVFTNAVTVTLSDTTAGASIYYTLDGTTPTINSTLYTAPFMLTNSATVTAWGFKSGAVDSTLASASFLNSSAVGNGIGLLGAYYSNQLASFTPPPTLLRTDAFINFNWQNAPPDPSISPTNFSVRWTGCVQPQYTGTYTFYTYSDAGVRLWVNGQLLINQWNDQPLTQWSASIPLAAQQYYNIELDYFYQNQGAPVVQLSWSGPSTADEIIPQTQLYPVTNPPPVVAMTSPANNAVLTAAATATLGANAGAQFNAVSQVAFYINGQLLGAVAEPPYALTTGGLAPGGYALTAVATDTTGLATTSAPVNITVTPGSGLPYGLSNYPAAPAFYNMPPVFTGPLPAQLSLTGVFSNTPNMTPVASLIPYSPNVPLWSDTALKVRYVSIPNSGAPYTPGEQIAYAPTGSWLFPAGTVFVKTFELLTNQSDPTSIHRLETRLLVRDTNGAVYGVTYKWRPDNSDADLLSSSLTEAIPITTPTGVVTQMWYYPSPSDCLQCHTPPANYVLGVNARQLNGSFAYPNGVTDNQLRTLNSLGLLYPAIDESSISNIEQLSAVTNAAASYEQRARSYLDANCAQCHQPNGPGPTFDARYDTPLASQNIVGTPVVYGGLGYDNVDIVTPDDVWRSSLYDRMNIVNPSIQMPPLARNLIDTNAVQVMAEWIDSLPGTPALPPPVLTPAGGSFAGYVTVTAQEPATNATTLYYTLDGSLPTTNSTPYTGPILVTNSLAVNANAWAPGYGNSVVGAAQFIISPGLFFLPSGGGFSNGFFQMSFSGPAGSNYVLQVSTNLNSMQWTSINTNTPAASPFVLSDPNPPSAARFYRVVQQP